MRALAPAATVTDLDPLLVPVATPAPEQVVSEAQDPVSAELVDTDQVSAELVLAVVVLEPVALEVLPPVSTSPPTLEAGDLDQETSTPRLATDTKMDTLVMMLGGDGCANVEQKLWKKSEYSNEKLCC